MPLWFDLSATYSDGSVCDNNAISVITAKLFYKSAELNAREGGAEFTNHWMPHSGGTAYTGSKELVAQPNDAPLANDEGYDKWSTAVYADFVNDDFDGTAWSPVLHAATVALDVLEQRPDHTVRDALLRGSEAVGLADGVRLRRRAATDA